MRIPNNQKELSGEVGEVFNLVSEYGVDPERVAKERLEAEAAAAAARDYQLKMQRTFQQCPGFLGADAPSGERAKGRVIIEPGMAREARDWLKRRFYFNESLELSDQGLCIEIIPKIRKVRGTRRMAVSFRPEQFRLDL